MKRLSILLVFVSLIAISCSEDLDPQCGVGNVVSDLPWLVELIEVEESSEIGQIYSYLERGTYTTMSKSQTVFVFGNCCPSCAMLPPLIYDCSSQELGRVGESIQWEDIKDMEVVWKSSRNTCPI